MNNGVRSLTTFDDGNGLALFASGFLTQAGGHSGTDIVRWDGSHWSVLPGEDCGSIYSTALFDDGSSPALYAIGFCTVDGMPSTVLAKWDGTEMSKVLDFDTFGTLSAMVSYDDGSGEALYVAGSFTQIDGQVAQNIAKWDGESWSALTDTNNGAEGFGGAVYSLTTYDPGNGERLFVGGSDSSAPNIRSWNGSTWQAIGSPSQPVRTLTTFDDGSGLRLFAGGQFNSISGIATNGAAAWDGVTWSGMGGGPAHDDLTHSLAYDDGSGSSLVVSTQFFPSTLARWDGKTWTDFAAVGGGIGALANFGEQLVAGGNFVSMNGDPLKKTLAGWNGNQWNPLGTGLLKPVMASISFDDGTGFELYVGGEFQSKNGEPLRGVARWDGAQLEELGPIESTAVNALGTFDSGQGPELYSAHKINSGDQDFRILRWSGNQWVSFDPDQPDQRVLALVQHDDGSGPALFAAGAFTELGGVKAPKPRRIAKWDGQQWSAVGDGFTWVVNDLASFDEGQGPRLFAAGAFMNADGQQALRIARWNGSNWSPVGGGLNDTASALQVFDDGSGPALYVGGSFTTAGTVAVTGLAKWDGSQWSTAGGSFEDSLSPNVSSLVIHNDGSGPALFAGGRFTSINTTGNGILQARGVARWDGQTWGALGAGMSADAGFPGRVSTMTSHDDGSGQALFAGGSFLTAGASGDSYLGKWGQPNCGAPMIYCTAKTSSAGCTASIANSSPSTQPASGANDYAVTVGSMQGFKNGHIFVGISGTAALPFLGGTLCVQPPTKRGPTMNSGGSSSSSCDGSFSQTVNDGSNIPVGFDAGSGNSAWYQAWYRDPQGGSGPLGSAFSNAIQLDFQ